MSAEQFELFEDYYVEAKTDVDAHLDTILKNNQEHNELRKLLSHSVEGGKRVRPVITMLVAEATDCPRDKALDHAAIVELIHNASLVADDRYDEDEERRGKPTTWRIIEKLPFGRKTEKFTTGMSIMAQDGLLSLALDIVEHPGVTRAMGQGVKHLVNGFYLEAKTTFGGILGGGYDKYIEVNKMKTGGLFAMAAWMPAIVGTDGEDVQEAARKYGERMGILYQIADDIVDDDLPPFVDDPNEELERWHDECLVHLGNFPDDANTELLRIAPAWVVHRMFEQEAENVPDEVDPSFIQ